MSPLSDEEPEIHGLGREDFVEEVYSFEFWFQSVQGYLSRRPYGRSTATASRDLPEPEREGLITSLCNYCIGETAALEGASGMIGFAPNRQAKIFLATQAADEARHLEVLLRRLAELGVKDAESEIAKRGSPTLLAFKTKLLDLVAAKQWEAALFAQNVILEAMEFTVFEHHAGRADPATAEILRGIVADERRHMGFGENDLGRRIAQDSRVGAELLRVKQELDPLVLKSFEDTMSQLGMERSQRPGLGRFYLAAVARLGFVK